MTPQYPSEDMWHDEALIANCNDQYVLSHNQQLQDFQKPK
jgi:hypothetical protein